MGSIHWFPGHMKKALNEVEEKIKLVDIVIEILDARAPLSSINDNLEKLITNKKRLVVISKIDLADKTQTKIWKEYLSSRFDDILLLDLTKSNSENEIAKSVIKLGQDKWNKQKAKGMKPQPIRAMILGVPNVGKSSLINRLAKRKAAGVQNKPGFTRGEQWIKVNKDFMLLDTPGILPMNYEDKKKAANLALIGSIREEILPNNELIHILLEYFKKYYPEALKQRYGINQISDDLSTLKKICEVRKITTGNNDNDLLKAEALLLHEFKNGLLGNFTIEWVD